MSSCRPHKFELQADTARARLAHRHSNAAELTLSTQSLDDLSSREEAILDVHEALLVLEQTEPRLAQVVEMRYYGGYTEAEIAETLGVTGSAVRREWNKARLLLKAALERKLNNTRAKTAMRWIQSVAGPTATGRSETIKGPRRADQ